MTGNCTALHCSATVVPPHVVWVGRVVIGRKPDQTFRSALPVVEPHFWVENRSPPRLPSWESRSTGRAMALPVSSFHGWSARPPIQL